MQKEMAEFIRERYLLFNLPFHSFFFSFFFLTSFQVAMKTTQLPLKQTISPFFSLALSCTSLLLHNRGNEH